MVYETHEEHDKLDDSDGEIIDEIDVSSSQK